MSFYTYLQDLQAWVNNPSIPMYGRWNHPPPAGNPNAPGEGGVDLTAPPGTPVYALGTGPLLSADTFAALGLPHPGSVLSQRVNVPGAGTQDIYYQHIDLLPGFQTCVGGACGGRIIQAGQQIGTVGSVGETELGFNPNWGSLYGPSAHPGPWPSDPRPWLAALATGAPAASGTGGTNPPGPNTGGGTTSGSQCAAWDINCIIKEGMMSFFGSDFFTQSMIVTVAVILGLIGVIVLVFGHGSEQQAQPVPVPA